MRPGDLPGAVRLAAFFITVSDHSSFAFEPLLDLGTMHRSERHIVGQRDYIKCIKAQQGVRAPA